MSARTAVIVPCLGLQPAVDAVLAAIPPDLAVFVVDDGSPAPIAAQRGRLLRHPRNRGYGAAQKTGYAAALAAGAERLVLLHGDAQYDVAATLALAEALDEADAAIGTRFARDQRVPAWRRWGIRGLTAAANLRFGARFQDLHNGARAYRASALARLDLAALADDYRFDHQVLSALVAGGARLVQRPVPMRYGAGVRSISPPEALRYGLGCLADLARPPRLRDP